MIISGICFVFLLLFVDCVMCPTILHFIDEKYRVRRRFFTNSRWNLLFVYAIIVVSTDHNGLRSMSGSGHFHFAWYFTFLYFYFAKLVLNHWNKPCFIAESDSEGVFGYFTRTHYETLLLFFFFCLSCLLIILSRTKPSYDYTTEWVTARTKPVRVVRTVSDKYHRPIIVA